MNADRLGAAISNLEFGLTEKLDKVLGILQEVCAHRQAVYAEGSKRGSCLICGKAVTFNVMTGSHQ